jgi:hypothetical protein
MFCLDRGYTMKLVRDLEKDGLICSSTSQDEFVIAQFDALFSLNKRRNEVWTTLQEHLW